MINGITYKYQSAPEKLYYWCPVCQDWVDAALHQPHLKETSQNDKLDRIIELLERIESILVVDSRNEV